MIDKLLPNRIIPKDVPKGLIFALMVACLLVGLSGMRYRGIEGILHTLENWLIMMIIMPCCTALVAMPIKWRDESFDIKLSYYLGMFVSLLFMLGKLRYWR